MKAMLDTNICIYLIKQRPPTVLEHFKSYVVGDLGISVITLAELEYGVCKSSQPKRNREALEEFISPLVVAAFDRAATAAYGRTRAYLASKGQVIGARDLLIAAHAVSRKARLVTNNEREFRRVPGLRVENWT